MGHSRHPPAFHTGYQRDRGPEPPAPQSDQDPGPLPQRRGRPEMIWLAITNAVPASVDEDPKLDGQRCWRSRSTSTTDSRSNVYQQRTRLHGNSDALSRQVGRNIQSSHQNSRDEPGGCPDDWPGGARREGGVSLVCGSCTEREKASVESGDRGRRPPRSREGACRRQKPKALSTDRGARWRTGP